MFMTPFELLLGGANQDFSDSLNEEATALCLHCDIEGHALAATPMGE
jgi:hypothetical protein